MATLKSKRYIRVKLQWPIVLPVGQIRSSESVFKNVSELSAHLMACSYSNGQSFQSWDSSGWATKASKSDINEKMNECERKEKWEKRECIKRKDKWRPNEDARKSFSITACEGVFSGASFAPERERERVNAKGEAAVMFYLSSFSSFIHHPTQTTVPSKQMTKSLWPPSSAEHARTPGHLVVSITASTWLNGGPKRKSKP